mgnify:CR=1 FL=1
MNTNPRKGSRTTFSSKLVGVIISLAGVFAPMTASAEVILPDVFGDGMVLQRELPVPIWGTADIGEAVTVLFADQEHTAIADENGDWMIKLNPLATSSEGAKLLVKASNDFSDLLASRKNKNIVINPGYAGQELHWICVNALWLPVKVVRFINFYDGISTSLQNAHECELRAVR